MRTAKQIDLIYISQDWFSSGECLVIDKQESNYAKSYYYVKFRMRK